MRAVLFPPEEIAALRAQPAGSRQITIATIVDPVALARAAAPLFHDAQLLCHPDGTAIAGLGAAWSTSGGGVDRFGRLQETIEAAGLPLAAPIFTGFAFHADGPDAPEWSGFHGIDARLPQVVVSGGEGGRCLILTQGPGGDIDELIDLLASLDEPAAPGTFDPGDHSLESHPPSARWRTEVEDALRAIEQGELAKVVLSRSVVVTTEEAPQAFELVWHLKAAYPQCYIFVWQAGESSFVGASPELLLEKRDGMVKVNPLAGSARRGEGDADDRAVGEALMHSPKDRMEHALVVDDIAATLGPLVKELDIPRRPSLRRMASVQHLSTEIVGRVDEGINPLTLVDALHPTPAVGGSPRQPALAFLGKVEGIDRGWYTGGIGWFTADGAATFAIALRCALIKGRTSYLYAGAGIVADSKPDAELDETRLKFRPMLSVLTAS